VAGLKFPWRRSRGDTAPRAAPEPAPPPSPPASADAESQEGADPATDIFVARQPIFDEHQKVFAYELLFRSGTDNFFIPGADLDMPSSHVISSGMLLGIPQLTDSRPAFLNFSRTALVSDFAFSFPPRDVVVELLESVEPDEEVIDGCKRLKAAGYRLALDDFVDRPGYGPLVEMADFIKVDVLATEADERARLGRDLRRNGRRMLAEKVETREAFTQTLSEQYELFQGYFFARPTIMTSKALSGFRLNYLRLIRELNRPDVDMFRLEEVVKQEASLTLRFLRRVNSAAFPFRMETSTLRHALVLLGEREIRRCATVWSMAEVAKDIPSEVIVTSTLRGRICEMLAQPAGMLERASDLFLIGMFSMLDTILQQPMEQILETLPLSDDVREALSGGTNALRSVLDSVTAYERGQWEDAAAHAAVAGITSRNISVCYADAIIWTRGVFHGTA
jgi:c-di-GMP-related signal transduction protein